MLKIQMSNLKSPADVFNSVNRVLENALKTIFNLFSLQQFNQYLLLGFLGEFRLRAGRDF